MKSVHESVERDESMTGIARAIARMKKRSLSRGLTLVELIIVITLIGVLTAAIAVAVISQSNSAKKGAAKAACTTLRNSTIAYLSLNPGADCPTAEFLKKEKQVDEVFDINDPWGRPYKVECADEGSVTVRSGGPDKKEGGDDDIAVPASAAAAKP